MKCFKCGTLIDSDTTNCPNCGQNLRKIKKGFSPNMYNKIKSISSNKSQKSIPMDISIGDSISEQYIIHEYLNDDLIFYSFIGIDSFNKQKVQIDFIKPTLLKTEYDKSQFINSLREEKFRQHENLAIIYDYGKHNSNYYIVSEYIEGITLREIIDTKQENFTLDEIEPIIAQITDALTDIHEDSLVGYLIPENIIIMKNILKIRNTFWFRCFNHKTVLKYFSSDSPSYHYLAPELRGGSPKLINATDLYSIGVILSSLLVGKIYKGVPFNLSEYNNSLPTDIDMLFLKLVHKNANKRFQNVENFLIYFDKLFSFTPIDHNETTRVVNTSDILSIEEENFDFEDEMETSMIDRSHTQNVITKFDDDEPETTVMPKKETSSVPAKEKKETFEEDEPETKVIPKKKKKPIKSQKPHSLKAKTEEVLEKQEEKEKKDSNTSFNSYKNPFYQPEEIKKEQENFQQQKEFQEYQKSVYQQLSDFQERDNKKNLLMIVGFFAFALIIIVLILVMFLRPNNTVSSNDAKLMATIKKQNEMIDKMNKKFDALERQKQKSKEEVLLAKKEREKKENELIEQEKKIKELDNKKIEKSNEKEKKKLEEEKKAAQLEKEKLQKELEAKKKKEEEKKKKQKELKAKLKTEQELLAKKKREAQNKKAQQSRLIKNKNLSKKLEEAKKREALKLAKKKKAEKLAKKREAEKLAKKKEQERLAKKKEEKKKLEQSKKKKSLDAEADALLAAAMEENKKETVVKKDGKCPKGMIKIKEGSFKYGSPASDPTRGPSDPLLKTINLNTYCIDRYESKGPISFTQAEARCKRKKKRICTTQEWEKACKGKYNRKFPYGNKFNASKCNTADADGEPRKYKRTGSFKKCRSPYGLYDMSGNLSEWTKSGNSSRQILKGGSYKSEDFDAKCSSVKKASKGSRKSTYGYRCCSNLE